MAKDPAVLFYTQDFLVGSSLFTPVQKGHYITLLCYQQQSETGSLPLEQVKVLMGKDFTKQWPAIQVKFKEDKNGFYNERMRKEINRRKQHSEKQKERVSERWKRYRGITAVDTTVLPDIGNTFLETEIEIENKKGGVGEKETPRRLDNPIGAERVSQVANTVWKDQIWREQVCMGHSITTSDLQKWMAQYNASISNDTMPDFSESKYKKLFGGWLNKQKSKGYKLPEPGQQPTGSPSLKKL